MQHDTHPLVLADEEPSILRTMSDRRYRDSEIRKIFELATRREAARPQPASMSDGLTLAEIQGIGGEVGVSPEAISRAAATLDSKLRARTAWGMPIEVQRTVQLPRAPTDHEWDQMVAELRATFQASGRMRTDGGLREWRNGNLRAAVEPTPTGYRLRLATVKGNAVPLNLLGTAGITMGAFVLGAAALAGGPLDAVVGPAMLATSGAAALLANVVRLPRWAARRQRQMEYIEAKAQRIVADAPVRGSEP